MNRRGSKRHALRRFPGAPTALPSALGSALALAAIAAPAHALIIQPVYSSSVTSLANAAQVESAFQAVANTFNAEFATPITVKIGVSWGNVNNHPLGAGEIGSSMIPLLGPFQYADITGAFRGNLTAGDPGTQLSRRQPAVERSHQAEQLSNSLCRGPGLRLPGRQHQAEQRLHRLQQ